MFFSKIRNNFLSYLYNLQLFFSDTTESDSNKYPGDDLQPDKTPFYANQEEDPKNAHYSFNLWLSSLDDDK